MGSALLPGSITSINVSRSSDYISDAMSITLTFSNETEVPSGGTVYITFPKDLITNTSGISVEEAESSAGLSY
jgi:hypothetical protein